MSYPASSNGLVSYSSPDVVQLQSLCDMHQAILDALPMSVIVYEGTEAANFRGAAVNHAVLQASGYTSELIGKRLTELLPPNQAAQNGERISTCLADNAPLVVDESYTTLSGVVLWVQTHYLPLPPRPDHAPMVALLMHDITERKQRELAERQQQEAIITYQAATLAALSTPLLAISDTTVVMPLIGTVDTRRIQHIMESLLTGVAGKCATYVILDITGVQVVDTHVASAFFRAAQAVQLLGAQMILTGIRPEVSQTLIGLGANLQGVITRSTLQRGIAYAMERERRREGVTQRSTKESAMYHDCYCPVTYHSFAAPVLRVEWFSDTAFVWVSCPYCDIWGQTIANGTYDQSHPQLHCLAVPYPATARRCAALTPRARREIRRARHRWFVQRARRYWIKGHYRISRPPPFGAVGSSGMMDAMVNGDRPK